MSLKVIGAGFGRTGTLSLKFALEMLGFDPCYHMMEVMAKPAHVDFWLRASRGEPTDWQDVFDGYKASVDFPSAIFWREQAIAFPEAKILLSLRDSDAWYTSVMNTIYPATVAARELTDAKGRPQSLLADEVIWERVFHGRIEDETYAKSIFERCNQDVIDSVPAENLLVYRPGDGWEPLCEFLQVAIPEQTYPRVNSTEDFKNNFPPPGN